MRSRFTRPLVLVLFALALLYGCASVGLKQSATISTKDIQAAIGVAQDTERKACFVTPASESGPHCTNPIAATIGLTDARHLAFAKAISAAETRVIQLSTALIAWHAGDPVPTTVPQLTTDIAEALTVAQQFVTGQGAVVLKTVQQVLDTISALVTAMQGGSR